MEAVPRMPMIWLDLKEAGDFQFNSAVRQYILKNYNENPDNYNEQLKKLETLRQSAVNVTRDFEGCSTLRKYFGQLHYLQSRIPMTTGQEAAVSISWTEIFSGKTVTHDDICYEQACILYNLGALHSMLGAMDNRVSEEGMKVSCTHFQCSAGAFSYLSDHFSHNFSVDMSHQILNLNINLMLGQAQECLLEKSMLDNRKSFLVARISAQVVDYYKEACRALENSETASMLGKIQKDWKKLVQMKIYYFASIAHFHMGKQAEEQQKYGEQLAYLQSALDKLAEAIKLAKGQPDTVQEALHFTMDVIGGKYNSAKKDNDFIYHETIPSLETLTSVKGAPLVKALPVNPTDPSVTGPDLFSKLVPMAAHESASLYSEEKAKLLRDVMAKIESKNDVLEQFMDSLDVEAESVDNLDMYNHIPQVLMAKCAALSVRPDTVKSLIQSMQVLSGIFTEVESSLREIRDILESDEAAERTLSESSAPVEAYPAVHAQLLAEFRRDLEKYMEAHEKASFTNTELHRAMNLHISNLRLLGGPLESLRDTLPRPQLSEEDMAGLQCMKRILGKVQEMRDQRATLEKQLRDLIEQDDITCTLVTTEKADIRGLFEEQLKKYEPLKVYIDQNLSAQENILKALTETYVQYATVRKSLSETEQQWTSMVEGLVGSYEAYEDLMKKSQEGKEFYDDLEAKASRLLERVKTLCQSRMEARKHFLEREICKKPPARPTAAKPSLKPKSQDEDSSLEDPELAQINAAILALSEDKPEELRSLPPDIPSLPTSAAHQLGPEAFLPPGANIGSSSSLPWPGHSAVGLPRFPANLPPPELLARIANFPTSGTLPIPGPLPCRPIPHIARQIPPQQAVYRSQVPQVGPVCPAPVRPSTTTVDTIQAPIPSYTPTPHYPVPPSVSAAYTGAPVPPSVSPAYTGPPQMGATTYPQFVPQMTQQKQLQHQYPPPLGQPLSSGYLAGPRTLPTPQLPMQTYPPGYMAPQLGIPPQLGGPPQLAPPPQPGAPPRPVTPPQYPQVFPGLRQAPQNGYTAPLQIPQGYQAQNYAPQQHPQVMPGPMPSPPRGPMPPQNPPLQLPPTSQTVPPVSQPYLPHQHLPMPPSAQPLGPHPQMQSGPRGPMPSTSQTIHPAHHPQMPPASQPHLLPGPQGHLPMAPIGNTPPNPLAPQHHSHPGHPPIPNMPQPPISMPSHTHVQAHHTVGGCYPGGPPMMPQQPLAPQSVALQQPQPSHGVAHSQPSMYPSNPGVNVPTSAPLPTPALGPHSLHPHMPPQHMLQPCPGGPPVGQPGQPNHPPSPSPAQSTSPTPGPSALALTPQQIPTVSPNMGATLPPTLSSLAAICAPSTSLFQRQSSSNHDLLSSSPESQPGGAKSPTNVLQPTKADPQEGERRKKDSQGILLIQGDPYEAPEVVARLHTELEDFRAQVESLEEPSDGEKGMSVLDAHWKELQEQQERDARQLSIAIARCYTMKNRHQDVMPYDLNRVLLKSGKDDYINASYIKDLSPFCPQIIATQAPLTGTAADFWLMVYEQKVSLVVMLVSEQEVEKGKVARYFPTERGQQLSQGPIKISLTTHKTTATHVERMICLQYHEQSLKRTVVHLQFTSWPELGLPDSKSNLLHFIQEVHGHYLHQRPMHMPVVVHCSSGVGRTGAFCLLYAAVQELEAGNGIADLRALVRKMRQQRKNMLQEKLHLKFCYEAVAKHAEQILLQHGVSVATDSRNAASTVSKSYSRQESQQDLVLGGDLPISSIQATIAKLSVPTPSDLDIDDDNDPPLSFPPSIHSPRDPCPTMEPGAFTGSPASPPSGPDCSSSPPAVPSPPPPNGLDAASPPPETATPPPTSSLELLASLAPEAFSMEGGGGSGAKQRVTKQSFLQPVEGQGLHGTWGAESTDPLSGLDPLWSLNKP
ncbi:tyrosine-protein phosphatase non-receptor type 23 [Hippocampus zosterae]|uniref:tyrosine-protein phosphatase non-receptor type 23 n=1 Tax=Hippocampus zosterae TaxID=109293 RepID=UPI00223D8FFC|nr:tyrosine-protein phosphatase non-receptor type 23 [Hippocampus zosterae]